MQQRLIQAKQADDTLGGDMAAAQTEDTAAQGKTSDAQNKLNGLQDETTGLAAKVKTAEDELATQTAASRKAVSQAVITAQQENAAFASARDNAPYYARRPDFNAGPATDPLQRVMLFGFPDSKTIFIRGGEEDVDAVMQMLADFDRPQAQTLMTLWSMEISSDASTGGYKSASKALTALRQGLESARIETDTTLDLLRECINAEAQQDILAYTKTLLQTGPSNLRGSKADIDTEMAYIQNVPPEEIAPLAFYDPEVIHHLGWQDDFQYNHASRLFLTTLLPNPSAPTTLAEALVILSLTTPARRGAIEGQFLHKIPPRVNSALKRAFPKVGWLNKTPALDYTNLMRFLGFSQQGDEKSAAESLKVKGASSGNFMSSNPAKSQADYAQQQILPEAYVASQPGEGGADIASLRREMIAYLQNREGKNALDSMKRFSARIALQGQARHLLARVQKSLSASQGASPKINPVLLSAMQNIAEKNVLMRRLLEDDHYLTAANLDKAMEALDFSKYSEKNPFVSVWIRKQFEDNLGPSASSPTWLDDPEKMQSRLQALGSALSGRHLNSREAALNEMLKTYVRNIDDDLKRQFVEPMFEQVRTEMLNNKGIGVGVIQRTQVLGSNRLSARVDPSASAALPIGETENALAAALQLGQIAAAVGTGGASTALTVLNGLDRLPKDAPKGVYGITTGNVFQVTPVVDPSGQAMRFRFDYVLSSPIREPNGVTDPKLSGIDRHSVNTEVQLSNMEIRLISQYEANNRLGITPLTTGGIPVLKDIPIFKELPLIGWFTRRTGHAAVTQQSLLLGQTTIFPTIRDICDLLIRPTVIPDFDSSAPEFKP